METKEQQEFLPEIRRARFDVLTIYEVSEFELDILEKGSPGSILLNLAIALFTIALSFLTTLVTVHIEATRLYVAFLVLTCLGFIAGTVLLLMWTRNRRSVRCVGQQIRKRLPPEGLAKTPVNG